MNDLNSLFSTNESRVMEIVNPVTGEAMKNDRGEVMGISLTDKETPACKQVIAAFHNRHKKKEASVDAIHKTSTELLVAATTGFQNLQLNGEDVGYSADMARQIYEGSPVIRKQADEFVGADENFIQGALVA